MIYLTIFGRSRASKRQRVTLVSKARYLNSKKKEIVEYIHGHYVREPYR